MLAVGQEQSLGVKFVLTLPGSEGADGFTTPSAICRNSDLKRVKNEEGCGVCVSL